MIAWLLKTIGVGDDFVGHLDKVSLALQRPAVLWVGLALLMPVGWFIVRRQRENLPGASPGLRAALCCTRLFILLALITVLAGPYLRLDLRQEKKPIVALLFDRSESMRLPAGPFEGDDAAARVARAAGYATSDGKIDTEARKALASAARLTIAQDAVKAQAKALLEPIVESHDVKFASFARDLTPLGIDPRKPVFPEPAKADAGSSRIGEAVAQVVDDAGGRPIAGIVVFTDGRNNGGRSPADAARVAQAAGAPVFTVPIGPERRLKDVALVDLVAPGSVSVGDTVKLAATIESQGFDGRSVTVELRESDVVETKELILRGGEQQTVELSYKAERAGSHALTVTIPPLPDEAETLKANNSDTVVVKVGDEKLKVLLIDGLPRWDFRFLKNALRRDHGLAGRTDDEPDVALGAELRRRSAEDVAKALPTDLDTLAGYHVVILGDISPDVLGSPFLETLGKAVREKGLGLIVEAGPNAMPQAYDAAFQALLPIKPAARAAGLEAPAYNPFRIEVTPDGGLHEAMRLVDDPGRSAGVWAKMPPYYWCASAERAAPGATVLAWNPNVKGRYGKLPLIAHHYAGKGRVLFVGTDSTWLWRQNVGDRFFYKFWGQAVRFAARADDVGSKKSSIDVRPARARPGEEAQVELRAFTPDGSPKLDAVQTVRVLADGKARPLELVADPAVRGHYTGRFLLEQPGEVVVAYDAGPGETIEGRVRVLPSVEELRHPNVDRATLELLASATGGAVVDAADLGSIREKLKGETKYDELHREASVWDNWLTLAIVAFVYSLDVGLRRLAGLS